jgi:hypothetical protein
MDIWEFQYSNIKGVVVDGPTGDMEFWEVSGLRTEQFN